MENEPLDMMFRLFTKGKLCENFNIYFFIKVNVCLTMFGNMDDMDKLIAECNARGIGLMLDMVLNHRFI